MPRQSKPYYDKARRCWNIRHKSKRHYLCAGGPANHAEAWTRAARIVRLEPSDSPVTVVQAVEAWLAMNPGDWNNAILAPFQAWSAALMLEDVHEQTLADYLRYLDNDAGYAPSTIRRQVRFARTVLVWCHVRGFLDRPVPPLPKLPRIPQVARDIDHEDLQAIFDELPPSAKRLLGFIFATAARPSEACLLRWEEIHDDRCELERGKTWKSTGNLRIIHMNADALALLPDKPGATGYVFTSRLHKPYSPSGLRCIFKRAAERAGVKGIVGPYQLRHTMAQHAVDSELPLDAVGLALGHELGSSETRVYARVKASRARQAVQSLSVPISLDSKPRRRAASDSNSKSPRKKRQPKTRKTAKAQSRQAG